MSVSKPLAHPCAPIEEHVTKEPNQQSHHPQRAQMDPIHRRLQTWDMFANETGPRLRCEDRDCPAEQRDGGTEEMDEDFS
jgi:hypothetical protein